MATRRHRLGYQHSRVGEGKQAIPEVPGLRSNALRLWSRQPRAVGTVSEVPRKDDLGDVLLEMEDVVPSQALDIGVGSCRIPLAVHFRLLSPGGRHVVGSLASRGSGAGQEDVPVGLSALSFGEVRIYAAPDFKRTSAVKSRIAQALEATRRLWSRPCRLACCPSS